MHKNNSIEKKNQLKPFPWLLLLFSIVFTLETWLQWRRGGGALFCSQDYTCFVHAYEHLSIAFARKVGEVCNFEFGL